MDKGLVKGNRVIMRSDAEIAESVNVKFPTFMQLLGQRREQQKDALQQLKQIMASRSIG